MIEEERATEMDRLLRWWWSDPVTRPIHPSSQISVPDLEKDEGGMMKYYSQSVRPIISLFWLCSEQSPRRVTYLRVPVRCFAHRDFAID